MTVFVGHYYRAKRGILGFYIAREWCLFDCQAVCLQTWHLYAPLSISLSYQDLVETKITAISRQKVTA